MMFFYGLMKKMWFGLSFGGRVEEEAEHPPFFAQASYDSYESLLQQLQQIWDEVGESSEHRLTVLTRLERKCSDAYKSMLEDERKSMARLLRSLACARAERDGLLSVLGEDTYVGIAEKTSGPIRDQIESLIPILEKLWKEKKERIQKFSEVQLQIQEIVTEITGTDEQVESPAVDKSDLSLKKLAEFHAKLQELQKDKSERLAKLKVGELCND